MRAFLPFVLLGLCAACGDSKSDDDMVGGAGSGPMGAAISCMPGTQRDCACIGGGMGTQLCNADGKSYAACLGCPEPQPELDAGRDAGPGSVVVPDAAMQDSATPSPPAADAASAFLPEPGPTCGVGLPGVCKLGEELCCVRSLATDSCESVGQPGACSCNVAGCSTLEVFCDGPEDCDAGQVCCGTLSGGLSYVDFECASSCDHNGTQRIACHIGQDMCPSDTVCAHSQILTNVQVCIDPSSIQQ